MIIAYVDKHGLDDVKALVDYAYQVAVKYGTASASLNALMYDTIAELEGVALPSAELAEGATYAMWHKRFKAHLKHRSTLER